MLGSECVPGSKASCQVSGGLGFRHCTSSGFYFAACEEIVCEEGRVLVDRSPSRQDVCAVSNRVWGSVGDTVGGILIFMVVGTLIGLGVYVRYLERLEEEENQRRADEGDEDRDRILVPEEVEVEGEVEGNASIRGM